MSPFIYQPSHLPLKRLARLLETVAAALVFAACADDSAPTCGVAGGTQACLCAGGAGGGQVCQPDGAWGACQCGSGPQCEPAATRTCDCPEGLASEETCGATGTWGECACAEPSRLGLGCDEASPCGADLLCIDLYEADVGICVMPCTSEDPAGVPTQADCAVGALCIARDGASGYCAEGCLPFVAPAINGCDLPERPECMPFRSEEVGICTGAGQTPAGQRCNVSTDCEAGTQCSAGEGICRPRCYAFSDAAGCAAGQVCAYAYPWDGTCSTRVLEPRLEPFAPCDSEGMWCDDNAQCRVVSAEGAMVCLPYCLTANGAADCPDETLCFEQFPGAPIGYCAPPTASD